jgi:hypothetical protein
MKQLNPYTTISEAMNHLDNGGRFYNLFTKANDGEINVAELSKVGGLFNEKQRLILLLEFSIHKLSKKDQVDIISSLDDRLRTAFLKYKAQELTPYHADELGIIGSNAIITGIPKLKESKSEFQGVILIPIATGKAMTFVPIPIIDQYDIYEIYDPQQSEVFLIAHHRGKSKLPTEMNRVAGVLKQIEVTQDGVKRNQKFLEINYYCSLEDK